MDRQRNPLLEPRFADDPPVKLKINAGTLGIVIAVLAGLGLISGLLSLLSILSIGGFIQVAGFGGIVAVAVLGLLVGLAASGLAVVGGWRMYQRVPDGKRLVIYALLVSAAAQLVEGIGYGSLASPVIGLIILFIVYYLVVISRFPEVGQSSKPTV